jgi:hypothetical protein
MRVAACAACSLLMSAGGTASRSGPPPSNPLSRTEWPKSFVMRDGATVTINQPQIAEWPNESAVTFYAAVSYQPKGGGHPSLGTVVVEADTNVALRNRLVHFSRFAVVDVNFPKLDQRDVAEVVQLIEQKLPSDGRTMRLDDVLAAVDAQPVAPRNASGLAADPPLILISKRPAVVVNIDGAPIWKSVAGTTLLHAVNTNWDLLRDMASNTYYLLDRGVLLTAEQLLGPWTPAPAVPAAFAKLPAGDEWNALKAARAARGAAAAKTLNVFVSRQPAELIVLRGEPLLRRVPGTAKLHWVTNTDSDLFREGVSGPLYYLVSGRWFAAPDLTGPWTFATNRLSADFRKIPLDHPRSHVLASVPGTPQAAEAVRLAQVRQVARVNKRAAQAPVIAYDGPPMFAAIPQTPILRAVNADRDVLKAGRPYYLCADGVWFTAAAPTGPWRVAGTVPDQIYRIPPSSPAYRVTAARVQEDHTDWTLFATTPAYEGMMVAGNTVVWGTGFTYAPHAGGSPSAPVYFPRPATFGAGAWYNPWTASFGRARAGYGPSGGTSLTTRVYDSWDARIVQTVDRPLDKAAPAPVGTTGVMAAARRVNRDVSVYAGHDGRVYRRRSGRWEKDEDGRWIPMRAASLNDAPILRQLDDDARARANGSERGHEAAGLQSEWGPRAASYRPSAAARR